MGEGARLTQMQGVMAALTLAILATAARGEDGGTFYQKKRIALVVGYNPGGSYDLNANLAASWLPRFIPGNPAFVIQHMPGVGGLKAANFLFNQAPRDGLTIGIVSQASALRQAVRDPAVEFDARRLNWIGRLATSVEVTVVGRGSPARTLDEARRREIVLAATSAGSTTDFMPRLMNEFAGTKFRVVMGYPGTTGALLAMQRGEVDGAHETADYLLFDKRDALRDGDLSVLVQYAARRHPALPDAPAMVEVARSDEDRRVLGLFASTAEIGRALVAPPDLPAERVAILRNAFAAMVADPAFQAEMKARNLELQPMSGDALQAMIRETLDLPAPVVARAIKLANPSIP